MAAYKTERQRRAQEIAKRDERIRTAVRIALAVRQITMEQLAVLLGISRATLYARMKRPGKFTVDEINEIQRIGGEYIGIQTGSDLLRAG